MGVWCMGGAWVYGRWWGEERVEHRDRHAASKHGSSISRKARAQQAISKGDRTVGWPAGRGTVPTERSRGAGGPTLLSNSHSPFSLFSHSGSKSSSCGREQGGIRGRRGNRGAARVKRARKGRPAAAARRAWLVGLVWQSNTRPAGQSTQLSVMQGQAAQLSLLPQSNTSSCPKRPTVTLGQVAHPFDHTEVELLSPLLILIFNLPILPVVLSRSA